MCGVCAFFSRCFLMQFAKKMHNLCWLTRIWMYQMCTRDCNCHKNTWMHFTAVFYFNLKERKKNVQHQIYIYMVWLLAEYAYKLIFFISLPLSLYLSLRILANLVFVNLFFLICESEKRLWHLAFYAIVFFSLCYRTKMVLQNFFWRAAKNRQKH